MKERKLIIYIACSLDGYISKPKDDLSFLDIVQKEGEDYGYNAFIADIDTVIVGRKTYDWVMQHVDEHPHADKDTYIITRSERPSIGNLKFYTGDIENLVRTLKQSKGKNIFCDGGAQIVNELLALKLFDEMIISIIPIMLGEGVRLFNNNYPEQNLTLVSSKQFDTGLVQLHYKAKGS